MRADGSQSLELGIRPSRIACVNAPVQPVLRKFFLLRVFARMESNELDEPLQVYRWIAGLDHPD